MDEYQGGFWQKTKRFFRECRRVLTITKKPDRTEFTTTVKVTSLGSALIGFIGFLITMAKQLLFT